MTDNEVAKPILSLEEARKKRGFGEYSNGVYKYKQNGIVRLIHEEKDIAEGLGAMEVGWVAFNAKNELAFTFGIDKGKGVRYNGETLGGEWEYAGWVIFNAKNELAFVFETKKGYSVWYNGQTLGGEWCFAKAHKVMTIQNKKREGEKTQKTS